MSDLEKIEWMIETDGFAVEVVPPDAESDPPRAGYSYTINFPEHVGFPDVVVFGLTPVAARGLLGLVRDTLAAGTEIPIGAELVGLLDNELRCCFAPVDLDEWAPLFATAQAWYRGDQFEVVQLVYPDRNGFLPYEAGFDQRLRFAQPVIGRNAADCERLVAVTTLASGDRPMNRNRPERRSVGGADGHRCGPVVPLPLDALLVEQFEEGVGAERLGTERRRHRSMRPVASISIATAGITAVCQTTAW